MEVGFELQNDKILWSFVYFLGNLEKSFTNYPWAINAEKNWFSVEQMKLMFACINSDQHFCLIHDYHKILRKTHHCPNQKSANINVLKKIQIK